MLPASHCRGLKDALLLATEHLSVRAIRLTISRTYCFCWLQELANPLAHPAWAILERALLPAAALWTAAFDQMAAATSAFVVCRLVVAFAWLIHAERDWTACLTFHSSSLPAVSVLLEVSR